MEWMNWLSLGIAILNSLWLLKMWLESKARAKRINKQIDDFVKAADKLGGDS